MDSESEEEVAQEETEATEDDEVTEDAETTEEAEDAVEEAQDEVTEDTGADEVEETTDEAAGRRMLSEKTLNSEPSFEDHFDNGLNYQLWTPEHTMMTGNNEF